jgi:NAD(P)-dependent dehydrogenase (short-subunit alcohol dehydrogenase family)
VTQAALPHLKRAGWGRIVNNTTSYRTMLRVLPYGATKAALESMSAVWALELERTDIGVNVLVPGGPTDTPFIDDASGWPREQMLRPAIMAAPISWLMSDASNGVTGKRFTAQHWDASISPDAAASKAGRDIGWPELAIGPAWFTTTP